ncbi:MAG: site-specific integrase [Betaproteobacteria bacterium]|nr:site-specific integrase [Betaproteobacteria bacterium]MDE1956321.1 site-specific integrase [Betaproteobacteria bacterium]MDE2153246.1 site-specific integrase [Betaproteobacteria bacterium]
MAISSYYLGKPLSELVEVAERIVSEKMRAEDEPRGKRDPRTKQYAKWSRGTVHNRLTYLHAACYEAYEKRRVETDYTRGMEIPSADNERQVYADRRQILGIAKACDRQDARALVLIGFYTGLRLGEMQKCQIVDGHIYVPPKASKNSKPRLLPAHPRIRHWALKYLPLKAPRITLQRAVERARKRTDSWDINIHALRHSAASAMVNNGVDLYAVGKVLGHLDLRSSRRYAHLDTETIGAAIGKIGAKKV